MVVENPMAPREFNDLRDLIIDKRDKLPKRLAQVAAYMVRNPDDIAFGTVGSIAEKAAVHSSTLVRFAQALGYEGFSDLQAVFQQRLRERPIPYEARMEALDMGAADLPPIAALVEGFSQASIRSVERFRERVEIDALNEATEILARANTIYLIGLRRSYPVASYLNYTFGTLGVQTVLAGTPSGVDREVLFFAGPRDAALAISFTPYAPMTIEYARQVASQKTPLIAITDSPFSPLATLTNRWFEIVESDFGGFRTLASTMTLVAALAVAVAEKRRTSEKKKFP